MSMNNKKDHPQSKAAITVCLQTVNHKVDSVIQYVYNFAVSILHSKHPSKRQHKSLLGTVESLLEVQCGAEKKIFVVVAK